VAGFSIPEFSGLRVHVIGDAIRDVYTQAKCLGAASKSPTLVYERGESQEWVGGAGVVAAHCRAAGAEVTLTTAGETVKERILVEGVKVAEFHKRAAPWELSYIGIDADAVIFADFQHGVFTRDTIPSLRLYARDSRVIAADSQTTDISWGNILDFAGCHLLFANEREARFAVKDQYTKDIGPAFWTAAAEELTHAIFLKLGGRGLQILSDNGEHHVPAFARQPIVDPIGAGDALLAYATLTYAITKDLEQAGIIGSLAAAESCAHLGNVPVTRDAVIRRAQSLG
jgi:bifunctional ADP-heptose synthase (sugar kinase/adenylyltransferase)